MLLSDDEPVRALVSRRFRIEIPLLRTYNSPWIRTSGTARSGYSIHPHNNRREIKKMKRILVWTLVLVMALGMCTVSAGAAETVPAPENPEEIKVVLVCDNVGTNPFLTQMVTGLEESKEKYNLAKADYVECADAGMWEDNIRAVVQEGYDLVIVAGGQGADPLNRIATENPDAATYVMVDVICDNENVKSVTFKEQEGAYLIGVIAGLVSGPDATMFGSVHANEGPGSWKWRWGYMEGIKSVNPEAEVIFNYTNSYTDTAKAKELALQQAAQGCQFINAASAVADFGTFEAALEKGFYTSGQDEDRTNPENPYILTTQIKDTHVVITDIVDNFMGGVMTYEPHEYGVADGVIGALYVTHEGFGNPRNAEVFTDEIVEQVKAVADQIASGELVLNEGTEEEYLAAQ